MPYSLKKCGWRPVHQDGKSYESLEHGSANHGHARRLNIWCGTASIQAKNAWISGMCLKALPICSGESSCRKCRPLTFTSVWFDQSGKKFKYTSFDNGSRFSDDEQLWYGTLGHRFGVALDNCRHIPGSPSMGICRGHARVGSRDSRFRNGAR